MQRPVVRDGRGIILPVLLRAHATGRRRLKNIAIVVFLSVYYDKGNQDIPGPPRVNSKSGYLDLTGGISHVIEDAVWHEALAQ